MFVVGPKQIYEIIIRLLWRSWSRMFQLPNLGVHYKLTKRVSRNRPTAWTFRIFKIFHRNAYESFTLLRGCSSLSMGLSFLNIRTTVVIMRNIIPQKKINPKLCTKRKSFVRPSKYYNE